MECVPTVGISNDVPIDGWIIGNCEPPEHASSSTLLTRRVVLRVIKMNFRWYFAKRTSIFFGTVGFTISTYGKLDSCLRMSSGTSFLT